METAETAGINEESKNMFTGRVYITFALFKY